jgi:predicted dithiol-disulfide oxidoreductase (DUF899 family)
MQTETIPHPPVSSREEWLQQRLELLQREKDLMHQKDRVSAARRRLPMVKLDKNYTFEGPEGKQSLGDLFGGKRQLIVYHFMFDPEWERGCTGCTDYVQALGDLSMLEERDTRFVLISRAPLPKLEAYKTKMGWDRPWYSSFGSDFNYDFHVTMDESKAPVEYNYKNQEELVALRGPGGDKGEEHGHSVFFRMGDDLFHTYSCFARSAEGLADSYGLLDITPYGRQEDFEDSPPGWPQKPTYGA